MHTWDKGRTNSQYNHSKSIYSKYVPTGLGGFILDQW